MVKHPPAGPQTSHGRLAQGDDGSARRRLGAGLLGAILGLGAATWLPSAWSRPARSPAGPVGLPPEVRQALRQAGVPDSALSVRIEPVGGAHAFLSHQDRVPVNPASLMKLVTTYAALDRLGPAWTWSTPVFTTGPLRDGVLEGDLVIQGRGDPTLVVQRLWQGLAQVRGFGVREILGDLVLDRSAFAPPESAPGDFDGDPSRPYNVQADALLLNFHAAQWSFIPDPARGVARVARDTDDPGAGEPSYPQPPVALSTGTERPGRFERQRTGADGASATAAAHGREVPLAPGPCADWRSTLQAESTPQGWRFRGRYPASCGTLSWPLADSDPERFGADLLTGLWEQLGGRLHGRVRSLRQGPAVPADLAPAVVWSSPPLSDAVRDINKFSNNVMAQQLFLTLARQHRPDQPASGAMARASLRDWAVQRWGEPPAGELIVDNGSGLSRHNRVTAQWLTRLLQDAWASPVMPEFVASLPISGVDGTLRRARIAPGRAHLKTGSLRDVVGLAGYVLDDHGRRHVLVALVQHPQAQAARPALDALVEWVLKGAGGHGRGH